ncbi:MAG: hypothetical protein K2P99_00065, partial [Burkholderiales bacterium]|nr:hypothetical protein [Burkholderiales bacterium]
DVANDIEANYGELNEMNTRPAEISPTRKRSSSPPKKKNLKPWNPSTSPSRSPRVNQVERPTSPRGGSGAGGGIRFKDASRVKSIERLQSTESLKVKSSDNFDDKQPSNEEFVDIPPVLENRFAKYTASSMSKVKPRSTSATSPMRLTELKRPGIHSRPSTEEAYTMYKSPPAVTSPPTRPPHHLFPVERAEEKSPRDHRLSQSQTPSYERAMSKSSPEGVEKASPRGEAEISSPKIRTVPSRQPASKLLSSSQPLPQAVSPPTVGSPPVMEMTRTLPTYSQGEFTASPDLRRPPVLPPLQFSKPKPPARHVSKATKKQAKQDPLVSSDFGIETVHRLEEHRPPSPKKSPRKTPPKSDSDSPPFPPR